MSSETASLLRVAGSASRADDLESFVDRYAETYHWYGSAKAALGDGCAVLSDAGDSVLLPSYLPDAVPQPFLDCGLEVEFYAIGPDLGADLADLESRLDDGAAAVVSVNYFGFPNPTLDEVAALTDDRNCYHVDDSAHSGLTVHDGTLLGTRGDLGVASPWKLFPVPNGALLYLPDRGLADRFRPSPLAGGRPRVDARDARFLLRSAVADAVADRESIRRPVERFAARHLDSPATAGPDERYAASRTRLSKLASVVLSRVDPHAVRGARRENYRAWRDALETREGVRPLYDDLPPGVCPQSFPVVADRPDEFVESLRRAGVRGAHSWPRLPGAVLDDPAYDTAADRSRRVVLCPLHQGLDPGTIRSVASRRPR